MRTAIRGIAEVQSDPVNDENQGTVSKDKLKPMDNDNKISVQRSHKNGLNGKSITTDGSSQGDKSSTGWSRRGRAARNGDNNV